MPIFLDASNSEKPFASMGDSTHVRWKDEETLDFPIEERLSKRPSLREKLMHSVALLRKAERIAKAYDPEGGFYLAFSGGKVSQALYHVAALAGVQFTALFSPTSVDPPEVIRFIRKQYPDVKFEPIKKSIYQAAIKLGMLPSCNRRYCCKEFKEGAGAGKVTLIGIRRAESFKRKQRNEVEVSGRKYSGTLEGLEDYRQKQLNKRSRGRNGKNGRTDEAAKSAGAPSVANPGAITSETLTGCISGKDSLLVSPILEWTEEDVWFFLNEVVRVPHCSLYDEGWHRIGCICCPMASPAQHYFELQRYPHVRRRWLQAICEIRKNPNREYDARVRHGGWIKNPDATAWIGNTPPRRTKQSGSKQWRSASSTGGFRERAIADGMRTDTGRPTWISKPKRRKKLAECKQIRIGLYSLQRLGLRFYF